MCPLWRSFPTVNPVHRSVRKSATILTVLVFFAGILLIAAIDQLIPEEDNPHEIKDPAHFMEHHQFQKSNSSLMRTGVFTALALAIHNFPEGLATFITALDNPTLAIPIVVPIALHNIPEGISDSVPIYFATGSCRKAFLYSSLSGLAEPVGALVGYLLLMPCLNDALEGIIFAAVGGIMVFFPLMNCYPQLRPSASITYPYSALSLGWPSWQSA